METKLGEVKGYTITYDTRDKLFRLKNKNGDEVGSGKSQDDVELKAEKLSKQPFKFPIVALKVSHLSIEKGRVTSFNADDRAAYFSFDNKSYGSHMKLRLGCDKAYELTEANSRLYDEVFKCRSQIKEIEGKIESLIKELEKPINLDYFGLKERFY